MKSSTKYVLAVVAVLAISVPAFASHGSMGGGSMGRGTAGSHQMAADMRQGTMYDGSTMPSGTPMQQGTMAGTGAQNMPQTGPVSTSGNQHGTATRSMTGTHTSTAAH